jgi:WD40 repeat protein
LRAKGNQRGRVVAAVMGCIVVCGAGGCGANSHDRDWAQALRRLVPGYLHSNPRRGALAALIAQRLAPTAAGRILMLTADLTSRNITRTFVPPWRHTQAATATSRAVIAASDDHQVAVWRAASGQLLFRRRLPSTISRLAASVHSQLAVSLDSSGALASWDLSDPAKPIERHLAKVPGGAKSIVALGLADHDTRAALITDHGTLYLYDLVTGARLAATGWAQLTGSITARRTGPLPRITAASFSTNEYSGVTTALVAAAAQGVFRIELAAAGPGKRVISSSELTGTITSLLEAEYSEPRYVVGTTAGVFQFNEKGIRTSEAHGLASTGLALAHEPVSGEKTLLAANRDGTAPLSLDAPTGSFVSLPETIGPEVTSLTQGAVEPVAIAADGTILIAGTDPTGISVPTSEDTSNMTFTADGDLLETRGYDALHIERLVKVKPGAVTKPGFSYREEPVLRSYYPAGSWWNPEESTQSGWYVNSISSDDRFVAAGGQDPTRTAVVLVWDAKSGAPLHRLTLTEGAPLGNGYRGELSPTIIGQVALIPSRHLLVAYSIAQELLVFWSTDTWQQVASLPVGPLEDFDVSPDENEMTLAAPSDQISEVHAGRSQSSVEIVGLSRLKEARRIPVRQGELAGYNSDGTGLVLVVNGQTIAQRTLTGKPIGRPISPGIGIVGGFAIRKRSSEVALALRSGGVILADLTSGRNTPSLPSPAGAHPFEIQYSPNGDLLATTNGIEANDQGYSTQTQPSLWDVSERELVERACAVAGGEPSAATWREWFPGLGRESICGTSPGPSHVTRSLTPKEPQLAYEQSQTVYLAAASGATEPVGEVAEQATPPLFAWASGGAVAWVAEDVLNVAEPGAAVRSVPCPCSGVTFEGEQPVALEANGSGIIRYNKDLAQPQRRSLSLGAHYAATLLASTSNGLLVSAYAEEPQRNSQSQIYLVPTHGRAKRVHAVPLGQAQPLASTDPSTNLVATVFSESGGACFNPESLAIVDTKTNHTDIPAMPKDLEAPVVRSLRWSASGRLVATIAPDCSNKTGGERNEPSGREYELVGGKLIAIGSHGYKREQNQALAVEMPGPVAKGTGTGSLTVIRDGTASELHLPNVKTFSLRP